MLSDLKGEAENLHNFLITGDMNLSRHKILILRHADFKVMVESLNCDVDIEVRVHCLLLHLYY